MDPILTTKLHIPPAHPNRISRSHLIQKLDEDLWQIKGERFFRRLTLIAAPAGYGKSTLLYEWVHHLEVPVAWISFEESDNDPVRFFQYLIASLQTIQPGIGETYLSMLKSQQSSITSGVVASVMASLVNEIFAIPQPFLLVFDDYHTLQDPEIHQSVKLLLDHLPENLSLVIATRADPPLSLSRLRARRQMFEVRSSDLRFSENEADTFLRQVMQLDLQNPDVHTLTGYTEGWIAGLQMAALALQGRGDTASYIRNFSGRERFVIDYLFEEVLSRQPEGIQTFLVQSSILERMTGTLCDAILRYQGAEDPAVPIKSRPDPQSGQQILEYLERANLFIVPLDHQREWFRYHHLFADLLRHHLRSIQSAEYIAGLYEQASTWCEQHGLVDEAMDYAALSGNQEQLAKLVELSGNTLVLTGQVAKRARLIRLFTNETLHANPGLCIECAWSEILARQSPDLRQAEVYLQMAEQTVAETPDCIDGSGYPGNTIAVQRRRAGKSDLPDKKSAGPSPTG
jgi:LuxR family maltose regulon positive regulatory protein